MAERREETLLGLAAVFLLLNALILTLSPAVREQSWAVAYRLSQWIGLVTWGAVVLAAQRALRRLLPDHDPYILPLAALLCGWGILSIWRIDSSFGIRQAAWFAASLLLPIAALPRLGDLSILRRYKYILLGTGLLLTAATIFLGTNPAGSGSRLWLGCCGVYLQPSEPLKLLLVVYVAAYLSDHLPQHTRVFPLLMPTLFVGGLALALLLVQRDLGTASLFILIYATVLYIGTGRLRVLVVAAVALTLAAVGGFLLFETVHTRIETWLNPWNDPSGRSYQIVQSLLAIANGGVLGRGPGLGSPSLVPVAQSDFIYSAITEETGLLGGTALLIVYALLLTRGVVTALGASQRFHRFLAAGLTAYLGIQSILIIGGDLRLLPLTGVTLPFVAYGGSSLLTATIAALLLLAISSEAEHSPPPLARPGPYTIVPALFAAGVVAAVLGQSWWGIVRSSDLLARTDNPRRSIADRYVRRGALLDRNNQPINQTTGVSGSLERLYEYPELSPVTGYTHPAFGQAGLEASLDEYLRGLHGNPASLLWRDQLLYGMPPPGLDVRLSLDLNLQAKADSMLADRKAAMVVMDARSGEILVMASHPTYNPSELDLVGTSLASDTNAPLLNRATQGQYPPGNAINVLLGSDAVARDPLGTARLVRLLGFHTAPNIRMPVATPSRDRDASQLRVSPLQMARAAATISGGGDLPAPRIALAVDTPQQGWVVLPALDQTTTALSAQVASQTASSLMSPAHLYWEWTGTAGAGADSVTWFMGGTPPAWQGTPLSIVVLLENADAPGARRIGEAMLQAILTP
jgi:cell division protein FtsW (lipid II flippase)